MNNKHLLVKSITLLYRESQLDGVREKSSELVRNIISSIKLAEVNLGMNEETLLLTNLRNTALSMCDDAVDHQYEQVDVLQRLKMDCMDDTGTYEALKEAIEAEMSDASIKRTCVNIRKTLHNHFREGHIAEILTRDANIIRFKRETIKDYKAFLNAHLQELEPYLMDAVTKDPAVVSDVDFSEIKTVENVFKEVKSLDDGSGIMRLGWQGVNRMLRGGLRRGEEIVTPALQHNFKTGSSLCIFSHVAMFNTPYMIDKAKKPLLLRISFEDDVTLNMQFLYTYIKENETGQKVTDLEGISEEELASYVQQKLLVNGYHVKLMRVNPSMWSYSHICNKILELEAEGYEIHLLMLDYLYLVPTTGCSQGPAGHDVRDIFRRMRNFTNPRKITLLTPHQISTAGKSLVREGSSTEFVKEIANKGYYAGSSQIDQEVDLEIYMHIVKFNGESWLTLQRGKHRIPGITLEEDLFTVYKFHTVGTIPWDIDKEDMSVRKVGAGKRGSRDEVPYWDQEAG